jgi:hypothetical protein
MCLALLKAAGILKLKSRLKNLEIYKQYHKEKVSESE